MLAVGIGVALVAALGNAIAVVLLALEARRTPDSEAMHASMFKPLARRPRWLAAVAVMIGAGVLQITALSLAPIAIVQPTLATSQLMLLAYARARRPEVVGLREVAGSLLVVAGIGCVVAAAPSSRTSYGLTSGLVLPMTVVGGLALATFVAGRAHRAPVGCWSSAPASPTRGRTSWRSCSPTRSTRGPGGWWASGWRRSSPSGRSPLSRRTRLCNTSWAITVAPVIIAFKVPLPVLMALWSGVEPWRGGALEGALFGLGLVLAAGGAATVGSSHAVAQVSGGGGGSRSRSTDTRAERPAGAPDRPPSPASALPLERGGGQTHPAHQRE